MCWGLSRALELGELQETNERSLAALFPGVPERERPQADVDEPDAGDDSQVVVATVRILEGQLSAARWRVSGLRTVGRWNLKLSECPRMGGWDPETRCSRPRRGREGNPYGAGICYVQRAKRAVAGCLVTVRYQVWSKAGPVTSPAAVRRRAICSVCWNMITYGPSSCRRRCRSR